MSCRTKVGSRLVRGGASPVVAHRWLCLSLKHVTACSGNNDRNSDEYMALNLKGSGENCFDNLDRADFCMLVNHRCVWLPEFHQVNRLYNEWKSFARVSILQLGVLKCLA